MPLDEPQGSCKMLVPDADADVVSAGILTVCMLEGSGFALEFDFQARGTES